MSEYGNGFTLDFAYCKNCSFNIQADKILTGFRPIGNLKIDLQQYAETKHDQYRPQCKKRELVISYNRVMIEKV